MWLLWLFDLRLTENLAPRFKEPGRRNTPPPTVPAFRGPKGGRLRLLLLWLDFLECDDFLEVFLDVFLEVFLDVFLELQDFLE